MRRAAGVPGAASVWAAGTAEPGETVSWAATAEAVEAAVSRAAESAAADISFRLRAGDVRKGVPFGAGSGQRGAAVDSLRCRSGGGCVEEQRGRPARRGRRPRRGLPVGRLWWNDRQRI